MLTFAPLAAPCVCVCAMRELRCLLSPRRRAPPTHLAFAHAHARRTHAQAVCVCIIILFLFKLYGLFSFEVTIYAQFAANVWQCSVQTHTQHNTNTREMGLPVCVLLCVCAYFALMTRSLVALNRLNKYTHNNPTTSPQAQARRRAAVPRRVLLMLICYSHTRAHTQTHVMDTGRVWRRVRTVTWGLFFPPTSTGVACGDVCVCDSVCNVCRSVLLFARGCVLHPINHRSPCICMSISR